MRGVVFLGERKLEFQEFPDPVPGPGEVVLEQMGNTGLEVGWRVQRAAPPNAIGAMLAIPPRRRFRRCEHG